MVARVRTDVVAFITSTAAGQEASPEQRRALEEAVAARFAEGGGSLRIRTDAGCFVGVRPEGGRSRPGVTVRAVNESQEAARCEGGWGG